jgi:hypothetical protein
LSPIRLICFNSPELLLDLPNVLLGSVSIGDGFVETEVLESVEHEEEIGDEV